MKVAVFGTESYDREFLTAANAGVRIESRGRRAGRSRGLPALLSTDGQTPAAGSDGEHSSHPINLDLGE